MTSPIRVLSLHLGKTPDVPTACQLYRTNIPYEILNQHGWLCSWDYIDSIADDYRARGKQALVELISSFDLIVLPRASAITPELMRASKDTIALFHTAKIPVVYEVDDDFTNEHRDLTEMGIGGAMEVARLCDAVTVTTPYLASLMRKQTHKPTYVLPNCINPSLWAANPEPSHQYDSRRSQVIGLSGSPTHEGDWRILKDVLPQFLTEGRKLALAAYHPDYLKDLPNVELVPGMDYVTYSQYVRQCDVVLCPIDPDDGFNMGKSPIKAIEGMAAARIVHSRVSGEKDFVGGAAVVATDHPVYRLAVQHGQTGFLVDHSVEGWTRGLEQVLGDIPRFERLQREGHKWVLKHHDIHTRWMDWASAYQKILRKTPRFT